MKRIFLLALFGMVSLVARAGEDMKDARTYQGVAVSGSMSCDDDLSISRINADKALALQQHPELVCEAKRIKNEAKVLNRERENGMITSEAVAYLHNEKLAHQAKLWKAMCEVDPQIAPLYPATTLHYDWTVL